MEKTQWKALYDFCNEIGGITPDQLVLQLKEIGSIDKDVTPKTLDKYCKDTSYNGMMAFLRSSY